MSKGITWRDAPAGGPWHFPGIPGVYATGVVVPLESTGRSLSEMKRIIAQHPDVNLKIVDLKPEPAPESPKAAAAAKPAPVAAEEA